MNSSDKHGRTLQPLILARTITFVLFGALVLGGLTGCEDSDDAITNIIEDPSLQGTYRSECTSVDFDELAEILDGSSQDLLQFQGSSFTKIQTLYVEENCNQPGLEIRYEGSFKVDPEALPDSPAGSLNVQTDKLFVKPSTDSVTETLNTMEFCGVSSFKTNERTEIKEFGTLCPLEKVPAKYYGAYQVKEDSLLLDHPDVFDMAEDPSEREAQLSMSEPFKKD